MKLTLSTGSSTTTTTTTTTVVVLLVVILTATQILCCASFLLSSEADNDNDNNGFLSNSHDVLMTPPLVPPKCQAQMDAFCNENQPCVSSITRINASLPLYARYSNKHNSVSKAWRCYSGSSLNAK